MNDLVVGPMLRHVTATSATIFVETDVAATVVINEVTTPTFAVGGHHYALVILEGLEPASTIEYSVVVNGEKRWPPADSTMPPSVIRTLGGDQPLRVLFGSCRAAAPHEPPWSLSATESDVGRGVDSLRAHGLRMLSQPDSQWPNLLVLLGDQVYADDPSPAVLERVASQRDRQGRPEGMVDGFEEYTWLYHESWRSEVERWLFSVVPSTMIFDDHDMVDDWNISERWVDEIRRQPWWQDHVIGGLVSYWIYQHLGNLSPAELRAEGMLDALLKSDDGLEYLTAWAMESERFTPVEGGYRFSYMRDLGRTRLVVIDSRNARNLGPDRAMVGDEEWRWIEEQCRADVDHLLLASSLPVMVPGGLHGIQLWNAALCDGRWGGLVGRGSEWLRRYLDLEDWPAFDDSLRRLLALLAELRDGDSPPEIIAILSGDIHFSYVARAHFEGPETPAQSRVYQLVSSPIRNALAQRDRRVIRFALTRAGRRLGGLLTRSVKSPPHCAAWELTHGPEFANEMGLLTIEGRRMQLVVERARPSEDGQPILETVIDTAL